MYNKLNPTPLERRVKLYRILLARWWKRDGVVVVVLLSLAWMWALAYSVGMRLG